MPPLELSTTADPLSSPQGSAPYLLTRRPPAEAATPRLAEQVQLVGAMRDSGFKAPMWLAVRSQRYFQVTALLYRILEAADGRHTLAQIAASVTEATGRAVSAGNVLVLIQDRLIPMGLIAPLEPLPGADAVSSAGSATPAVSAPPAPGAVRSPLKVNMRLMMVRPGVIERVARPLQFLFFPPVVALVLILVALTQWWAYFVHGIASSLFATIYHPDLIPAFILLTVGATIFHEFGHATALRYGGGRARTIGAGFYLMFPVFYTDITDSYRLGRWARVRTDLGGFYFNLLFALGITALYAVTRWEFVLAVILWTDLEIISQCLPFLRYDGYWVFADLTGIPDSFTLIGPFVRSVLPARWRSGRQMPALRRWVKAAFAMYIVVAVPMLVVMLSVLVLGVPRILASAWSSYLRLAHALGIAHHHGQLMTSVSVVLQMLLLSLTVLGLVVALVRLGRVGLTLLWRHGRRSLKGRLVASLVTVSVVVLLLLAWAPRHR
ncbi:MAG TPA: hypothetical protein VF916_03485 [Ktedonobacterales bacterium]